MFRNKMDASKANHKQLREDEEFVIRSLASSFEGRWDVGENPPDAYLIVKGKRISVEISTLTQHVPSSKGGLIPRLSEDSTAIRICEELNDEIHEHISECTTILLTINSPILKARQTKKLLAEKILEVVHTSKGAEFDCEAQILGNKIRIHLIPEERPSGKKVVGLVPNSKSNPDILLNAKYILKDRISVKTEKCQNLNQENPLWLALLNDYWLADINTYRNVLTEISVINPFEKIIIVSWNGAVTVIQEKER